MENVYGVIDLAKLALNIERTQVSVASENIANINNAGYVAKSVNKSEFLNLLQSSNFPETAFNSEMNEIENAQFVTENPLKQIRLDQEVFDISNAEMRYQAIAQMIKEKFGLIELTVGGKR